MGRRKSTRYVIRCSNNCYYHPHKQMLFGEWGKKLAKRYARYEAEIIIKRRGNDWPDADIEEVNDE